MFVSEFLIDNFVILKTEALSDFGSIQGVIEINNCENWVFCIEKEGKE